MAKKLIPFRWLPASWGLTGVSRDIAKAEYELEGEELERVLNKLKHEGTQQYPITELEIDKKYGKIEGNEYEKKMATLKGEPWVCILTTNYDPSDPLTGSLDLDWNEEFIKSLEDSGYLAPNDYEVVDMWLTELCRNMATETYGGVGDFDERAAATLEQMKRNSPDEQAET